MRRIARWKLLLAAGILLSAISAFYVYPVYWRFQLLGAKMTGLLPDPSWAKLFGILAPRTFGGGDARELLPAFEVMKSRSDDSDCPVLWNTPLGPVWGRDADGMPLFEENREQILERVYDRPPAAVRPGDVVLDVGSHLGVFTRFALIGGASVVIAFEPQPVSEICFQKTFREEILQRRVILIKAAAWHAAGFLRLGPGADNLSWTFRSVPEKAGERGIRVPAVTIDNTEEELKLSRVDFIKMDIEGSERNAIEGARQTITRYGPRMAICTYHRRDDLFAVLKLVSSFRPAYQTIRIARQIYFH